MLLKYYTIYVKLPTVSRRILSLAEMYSLERYTVAKWHFEMPNKSNLRVE